MKSFLNINFSKSSLCESIIATSKVIREDFSSESVCIDLIKLVEDAKIYVFSEKNEYKKLEKLLELFYTKWNFGGASGVYNLSDLLWIDYVLKTHQGTAVSLGIILLHIAEKLNLHLVPIIFPTQLILKSNLSSNKNFFLINPLNGEILNNHILEVWLKGNISPTAKLYKNDLNDAKPLSVIRKMLDNLKSALMEEQKMELALNVSNVILQIAPNDPYEIRDRGLIYAQLDCEHVALTDLIYFVENCPDDPISEIIKLQIHAIEQKKILLH
ncbi:UPF0162 protein YchA [Buchnera aphidicola (Neophyllaphis podocarpi)]|uniref:invasion regulator SirB1 n=1 Tax=Buchnera aphidicola TaxID=9 RepID=UPI0034647F36